MESKDRGRETGRIFNDEAAAVAAGAQSPGTGYVDGLVHHRHHLRLPGQRGSQAPAHLQHDGRADRDHAR
jgi:hypothetical protein